MKKTILIKIKMDANVNTTRLKDLGVPDRGLVPITDTKDLSTGLSKTLHNLGYDVEEIKATIIKETDKKKPGESTAQMIARTSDEDEKEATKDMMKDINKELSSKRKKLGI